MSRHRSSLSSGVRFALRLFPVLLLCAGRFAIASVWEPGAELNPGAPAGSVEAVSNRAAADGNGNWVAAWDWGLTPSGSSLHRLLISRSSDNATTWSGPLQLTETTGTYYLHNPCVATDRKGLWVCAWIGHDLPGVSSGTDEDIVFARSWDNGTTWSRPALLNSSGVTDSTVLDIFPVLATDGQGNWICVWQTVERNTSGITVSRSILVSRSTDDAASWSAPAALDHTVESDRKQVRYPTVECDRAGHWTAAWWALDTSSSQVILRQSRSVDAGATWTSPAPLMPALAVLNVFSLGRPDIAMDSGGDCVAMWSVPDTSNNYSILMSRSTDYGETWMPTQAVRSQSGVSYAFSSLACDGHGTWMMTWQERQYEWQGYLGYFAVSIDAGASWTGAGYAPSGMVGSIALESDGAGVWTALGTNADSRVIASRAALMPTAMPGTTAIGKLNTNGGSDAGDDKLPDIAADRSGTWVCVWESNDSLGGTIGTDRDILVSRRVSAQSPWSPPQPLSTAAATDTGSDECPRIATNGEGAWIVVWAATKGLGGTFGTDYDILNSRSLDGGRTWSAPAAVAPDAAIDSAKDFEPAIASDGARNWVVVWCHGSDNGTTQVLCSRSTNNGFTWSAPQVLSTSPHSVSVPSVASDRMGGWVVSWIWGTVDLLTWRSHPAEAHSLDNAVSWTSPILWTDRLWASAQVLSTPGRALQMLGDQYPYFDSHGYCEGGEYDLVLSQSTDRGSTWSQPLSLTGAPISCEELSAYLSPSHGASSTNGATLFCWSQYQVFADNTSYGNDYIAIAWSRTGYEPWDVHVLDPTAFSGQGYSPDEHPRVATDDRGNWTVVWQSVDAGATDYDIRFANIETAVPTAARDWSLYN
jgi:hypothetical protein